MIYTDKWAFMHNARCGGHNFKHRVSQQINVNHPIYDTDEKYTRDQWIHQTIDYWKNEHGIDNITWITMVRNPYSRLVSWYFRRFHKQWTFPQYIKNITSTKTDHIMWMHITDKIGDNDCKIFYFENMYALEKYVGCSFADTRMNTTDHAPIDTYYDDDLQEMVYNAYKREFEIFGYSADLKESSSHPT